MADLPTWTFRPEWSNGILERLEWLSDVLPSSSGAEQTIALRLAPRRSLEADFLLTDNERSYLSLALQRLGSAEWLVPLWFDRGRLGSAAAATDTTLSVSTTNREFRVGDFAMLRGPDAFSCETVELAGVNSSTLTLADPLVSAWRAGTTIHPLRTARLEPSQISTVTDSVGKGTIRFQIDADNEFDGGDETFDLLSGIPLLLQRPDWSQDLSVDFEWLTKELDGKTGLRRIVDTANRAFQVSKYGITLNGLAEHWAFRELLYRLRGRQKPFWRPSWTTDFTVATAASAAATHLDIEQIGLALVGGITPDIERALIGGNLPVVIDGLGTPPSATRERLNLVSGLARPVLAGETGQFLSLARLDQDVVTIKHVTDTAGVSTVALAMRDFNGARDGSADGHYPIAEAEMTEGGCGDCGDAGAQWALVEFTVPLVAHSYENPSIGDVYIGRISGLYLRCQQVEFSYDTLTGRETGGVGISIAEWRSSDTSEETPFLTFYPEVDPEVVTSSEALIDRYSLRIDLREFQDESELTFEVYGNLYTPTSDSATEGALLGKYQGARLDGTFNVDGTVLSWQLVREARFSESDIRTAYPTVDGLIDSVASPAADNSMGASEAAILGATFPPGVQSTTGTYNSGSWNAAGTSMVAQSTLLAGIAGDDTEPFPFGSGMGAGLYKQIACASEKLSPSTGWVEGAISTPPALGDGTYELTWNSAYYIFMPIYAEGGEDVPVTVKSTLTITAATISEDVEWEGVVYDTPDDPGEWNYLQWEIVGQGRPTMSTVGTPTVEGVQLEFTLNEDGYYRNPLVQSEGRPFLGILTIVPSTGAVSFTPAEAP